MSEATEKLSVSLVLIGQFNPSILSPAWFQKTGLITDEDLEAANVAVIHPEIATFTVGGFAVDVRSNRFSIQVESEPVIRVIDAAEVLFRDLLPHSPIQQFGINYQEHFLLDSPERRIALGRALAPLGPWQAWGERIKSLSGENVSGMVALVMHETYEGNKGYRRVDVQPSSDMDPPTCGVFMSVNDHNILAEGQQNVPAGDVIDMIQERFDNSIAEARTIVGDLYRFAMDLRIS